MSRCCWLMFFIERFMTWIVISCAGMVETLCTWDSSWDSPIARMYTVYTMHTVTLPRQPHWFSKARPVEFRRQDEIPAVSDRDWLRMSLSRFNDTFVNFWGWTRAVYTRRQDGTNVEMAVTHIQCVQAHGLWLYVWQAWNLRVLRCSFPHTNFQWCYIIFCLYSRRPWPGARYLYSCMHVLTVQDVYSVYVCAAAICAFKSFTRDFVHLCERVYIV